MGCCAKKSVALNDEMKEKIDKLRYSFFRTMTINRRTIREITASALTASIEIDIDSSQIKPKPKNVIEEIKNVLKEHFLFKTLEDHHLHLIISEMQLHEFPPNTVIFHQGSSGRNFYLISTGSVEIIVNNNPKVVLRSHECFGELALLYNSARTATVRTIENSTCWVISRETFRGAVRFVASTSYEETKKFLESLEFFQIFSESEKKLFISYVSCMEFSDEQNIISEGDPGKLIFIVQDGKVKVSMQKVMTRVLSVGELFGELALVFGGNRTASAKALGKVSLLAVGNQNCYDLLEKCPRFLYKNLLFMAFEANSILKDLNTEQYMEIIKVLDFKNFESGEEIIGPAALTEENILIVLKGSLKFENTIFEKISIVGLEFLINEEVRGGLSAVVGEEAGTVAFVSHDTLKQVLKGKLADVIKKNEIFKVLSQVSLFRILPQDKLEALSESFSLEKFTPGAVIIEENSEFEFFFIVKSGQICLYSGSELKKSLFTSCYYGEKSLVSKFSEFTAKSLGNSEIWKLSKQSIQKIIDKSIIEQMRKRLLLQHSEVELCNLQIVKLLGTGAYGNVFLVYHPINKQLFALKAILKSTVQSMKIQDVLLMEKKVLQELDHPLLTKLVKTFKDEFRFYFLLEFIQGVNFFDVLLQVNLFKNDQVRFYASCIIMMLQNLHSRNIIYRDLKPDNLMIDIEGYPILINFSGAKLVKDRTFTVIGTPHYLAPEIIQGTGYNNVCDYWSLGVIIYECLVGKVPFGHHEEDLYSIYKTIISQPVQFPKKFLEIPARPFIEKLLEPDPKKRLHGSAATKDLWLQGMNWDYLLGKFIKPPYVPKVETPDLTEAKPLEEAIYMYENCDLNEDDGEVVVNDNFFKDF